MTSMTSAERRCVPRRSGSHEARLFVENHRYSCRLLDWSRKGARLSLAGQMVRGQRVGLAGLPGQSKFDGQRLFGRVAWTSSEAAGIAFDEPGYRMKVTLYSPFSLQPRGQATLADLVHGKITILSPDSFRLGDCPRIVLGPLPGLDSLELVGRVEGCHRQSSQATLYHLSLGHLPPAKTRLLSAYRDLA